MPIESFQYLIILLLVNSFQYLIILFRVNSTQSLFSTHFRRLYLRDGGEKDISDPEGMGSEGKCDFSGIRQNRLKHKEE